MPNETASTACPGPHPRRRDRAALCPVCCAVPMVGPNTMQPPTRYLIPEDRERGSPPLRQKAVRD
jgi:hypothetical protein